MSKMGTPMTDEGRAALLKKMIQRRDAMREQFEVAQANPGNRYTSAYVSIRELDSWINALASLPAASPSVETAIDCPLCGVTVKQVASATLSLALWQHVNWACGMSAYPAPSSPQEPT